MRALSRKTAYRKSTLRNLATSLVLYERITTTTAKAKEIKPIVEHLINIARPADLNSRRKLLAYLFDENATKKVLEVLVPRFKDIPTGFIKSYRIGPRLGDGADMTILEFQKEKEKKAPVSDGVKEENAKKEKSDSGRESNSSKATQSK